MGKAKTYLEKLGFKDEDRKDSEHDAICIWASKKENYLKIFKQIIKPEFFKNIQDEFVCKWERPVKGNNNFIAGFIDVYLQCQYWTGETYEFCGKTRKEIRYFDLNLEVKTSIGTLGDLIREIKFYESLLEELEEHNFCILLKKGILNESQKKILKLNGIFVYELSEEELNGTAD